jgi:hypothetical protein
MAVTAIVVASLPFVDVRAVRRDIEGVDCYIKPERACYR